MDLEGLLPSFRDELEKIAAVRGAVKQYRRALQALAGGHAFHGVDHAESRLLPLLQSGSLKPSQIATHGPGVYLWNSGGPKLTYLNTADSSGLAFPHPQPGSFKEPRALDTRPDSPMRRHMTVWQHPADPVASPTTPLQLPQKTNVIAPQSLLGSAPIQKELQTKRLRPMDSAIFNRAEADRRARALQSVGYGEGAVEPSAKELKALAKRKVAPSKFKKLRAVSEDDIAEFAETSYPAQVRALHR